MTSFQEFVVFLIGVGLVIFAICWISDLITNAIQRRRERNEEYIRLKYECELYKRAAKHWQFQYDVVVNNAKEIR